MNGQQSLKSSLRLGFDCHHPNLHNGPSTILLTNYPPLFPHLLESI